MSPWEIAIDNETPVPMAPTIVIIMIATTSPIAISPVTIAISPVTIAPEPIVRSYRL
jgi:hypothetical protein